MLGVKGTKEDAKIIRDKVKSFLLTIALTLSKKKTKITNINADKVTFLETDIKKSKYVKISKIGEYEVTKRKLRMEAPLLRIKFKLTSEGFIKNNKSYPKFI
jgi:hypothetical protein